MAGGCGCSIVLGNRQLKDVMEWQMTHFQIAFYLGVVPLKITDVSEVWPV